MTEVNNNIAELKSRMAELRARKAKKQVKLVGKTVMSVVDDYIKLSEEKKALEKIIEQQKDIIKSSMEEKEITELYGASGRSVYLLHVDKVPITGNFTAYNAEEVGEFIPFEYRDLVFKTVVDRDMLENLVRTGKVDDAILGFKITSPSEQLRIR